MRLRAAMQGMRMMHWATRLCYFESIAPHASPDRPALTADRSLLSATTRDYKEKPHGRSVKIAEAFAAMDACVCRRLAALALAPAACGPRPWRSRPRRQRET